MLKLFNDHHICTTIHVRCSEFFQFDKVLRKA
jgi:hypothetical protein